ncbi:MAG: hypothetical protein RIQ60_3709 [Pseudomonadota bacterium]|jgi:MFS family permease
MSSVVAPSGPSAAPARLPPRVLFALVAGQVSLHSSMAGLRLCLPLMMLTQGGWAGWPAGAAAGVVLGLFAAAPVLLALPAGRWVDRRGYHKPASAAVGLGVFGGAVACLAALLSPALTGASGLSALALLQAVLLVVAGTCIGTGCNVGLIAMQRIAGKLAHDAAQAAGADAATASGELRRVFSWLGIAPALGNVGGPLLAGVLIDHLGSAWACALLCLLPLGKSWWSRAVPPDGPPRPRADAHASSAKAGHGSAAGERDGDGDGGGGRGARGLLALPGVRRLLLINWFFSSSWDLHGFVVPLLGHERGLSASAIGTVLGLFAAAVALVRMCIPLLARRLHERQVLSGAMALVALVFAAYPLAHTAVQMGVCAVVLGLALGSVQPMIMTALHHLTPPERQGEAIALRSAIINLSSSLLPMAFGVVGAALGATLLFRGMAVVLVLGLPLALRMPTAASR